MTLPTAAYTQLTPDLRICRLLNGMWQVSGGHGGINPVSALREMFAYHDDGFTTWDLADHYGPAEDLMGNFRRELSAKSGAAAWQDVQAFTKWVPRPTRMTRAIVQEAMDVSRRRMGVETIDLLQFHWWDYGQPGYLDALGYLSELRAAGQIRHLALTNFDTARLREITEKGIRIVSNQVQFSVIDQRPLREMIAYCAAHDIQLLAYGTFGGGLISERYLGQPEPRSPQLTTASLRKYKGMIDQWGGWALFQELLTVFNRIAQRHRLSIANVAARWVLDQSQTAGVIVGARLGIAEHRADNARVFGFALDDADRAAMSMVTSRARDLFTVIGDCGDEYRR